jgi:hypothetical protein
MSSEAENRGASLSGTEVMVGTPISRRTSFALDKFLSNQQEIQQAYPNCSLVLATDESDFVAELKEQIVRYYLKGEVITYETVRPDYARSRVWSVACAREALRRYVLSQGAEYLLFLDGDMVYAPSVISTMKARIQDFDVITSGYRKAPYGMWGFGNGCLMINREILDKIAFRCYEFKNGQEIDESETVDIALSRCHARVNKGIFVYIKHYINNQEYYEIKPQPVGWFRAVTNSLLLRNIIVRLSIVAKYNIARKLQIWFAGRVKIELKR